ncbi:hypothetical protein JEY40_39190 [Bradyrhizobium japonicum]|uniref:bestrophin-like domain n=1 Tax=Bradyrhizobium japonicum TaxID=375 RepID=UPI002010702D|nr:hypothetical protein [Bradyrhizobium japonicum]UQD71780.1 hypothetical protein JEY40_39190 [Bradyrhizobium japonicum]
MENLTHYPLRLFVVSFMALSVVAVAGLWLRRRYPTADDEQNEHLGVVLAATLTLLGLIIGFSFSMAANRYDQRKNFEEAEANAIGTEILRADFLPTADAANVRKLLAEYTGLRIRFYIIKDDNQRKQLAERTAQLQAALWSAVRKSEAAQPTPVEALAIAGMNDVINSQGYTQAAFWNRIPTAAWFFMAIIALCSNALMGYRSGKAGPGLLFVLPLIVSFAFLLIADIDAPRHGLIEVRPQNLESLASSLGVSSTLKPSHE